MSLVNYDEPRCAMCMDLGAVCLDFDNDERADECWCPQSETCGDEANDYYM